MNTETGEVYAGASILPCRHRWNQHRSHLRSGQHRNAALQADWDEFGPAAFVFEMVEACADPERLSEREVFWIKAAVEAGPCYNRAHTREPGRGVCQDLITVTEAAALLEADRSTVKFLIAEDRLTAYRLQPNSRQAGRKLYLSRQQVERLAASDWRRRAKRDDRP